MTYNIITISILVKSLVEKNGAQIINFEVYQDGQNFIAVPFVDAKTKETTGLPDRLHFSLANNRIQHAYGKEGVVVDSIVKELRVLHIV